MIIPPFDWIVCDSGYSWLPLTADPKTLALVANSARRTTSIQPLQTEPGLFLTFAGLNQNDPQACLEFANVFGHLGEFVRIKETINTSSSFSELILLNKRLTGFYPSPEAAAQARTETHSFWIYAVQQMNAGVTLWKQLDAKQVDPSRLCEVNDIIDLGMGDRTRTGMTYNRKKKRLEITIRPNDLLGAMWLQFAHAVAENYTFRPCRMCSRYIRIGKSDYSNKMLCSLACRQRAYRKKKHDAVQLADEGLSAVEIAAKLESEVHTVNEWLKRAGKDIKKPREKGHPIDL